MSIEKKILDEMNSITPDMSEELKNHPITKREKKPGFSFKLGSIIGLASAFVIALVTILSINFLAPTNITAYYLVEINPSVMMKVEKGKVTEVKSGNNDGDALLMDLNLTGKNLNSAVEIISDEALKEGFIEESGDILRISSVDSSAEALDTLKVGLEDYFKECGYYVAILPTELNLTEFNAYYGTDATDFSTYFNEINPLSYLNKDINENNIEEIYKNDYLFSYLFNSIRLHLNDLKKAKALINEIDSIYDSLLINDSVHSFIKDYFYLVDYYKRYPMPSDVKVVMDLMESKLDEYNSLTGNLITSKLEITANLLRCNIIDIEWIEGICDSFEAFLIEANNKLNEMLNRVVDILSIVIPELEIGLNRLLEIPKTIEEYTESLNLLTRMKKNERIKENEESYNERKQAITSSEYNSFIDRILGEYGSLEKYFKENRKK